MADVIPGLSQAIAQEIVRLHPEAVIAFKKAFPTLFRCASLHPVGQMRSRPGLRVRLLRGVRDASGNFPGYDGRCNGLNFPEL